MTIFRRITYKLSHLSPSLRAASRAFLLIAFVALVPAIQALANGADVQHTTLAQVARVIDGDTILICCIAGKFERVRYIGMNTPETTHPVKGIEYYGKEAAEANQKFVADKTVRLEFDVERRDKYGRLLAYVYLEDGTFVNAWLVEHGYAQVMTVPPNVKYQGLFLKLQRKARGARLGLWGR